MRCDVGSDLTHRPRLALVGGVFDHFELQARWMVEPDKFLAKALLNAGMLHLVVRQVFVPEFGGPLLHRVGGGLDLARSWTARHPLVRESGVNRARLRTGVRIIQVVMGVASVK